MTEAAYTIKDLAIIGGLVALVGGAVFSGWNYVLHGKIKSIDKLWKRSDDLEDSIQALKDLLFARIDRVDRESREQNAGLRIEMAKDYATKRYVAEQVAKLEAHMEKLEGKIDQILERLPGRA